MLFRARRPIALADYTTRAPRPRPLLICELAIFGSAGELGSIRGRAADFLRGPLPPEEKMRSTVGKCGGAVVSRTGHQKYLVKCSIKSQRAASCFNSFPQPGPTDCRRRF